MNGVNGSVPQGAMQGGLPTNGQMPAGGPPSGFGGHGPGGVGFLGPWGGMVGMGLLVLTCIILAVAYWKFLSKAGITPVIALLMLIPVVNLGVALWASFAEWPALKEVSRLREQVATYELRAAQAVQAVPAGAGASTPAPV
jgi:hypothetical protein